MPDAWDDDWIQQADSKSSTSSPAPSAAKLSKAERRAKQAEFNRQLWEDAEKHQGENYFLKTKGVVPLKQEFKPAVKVLSRKPAKVTNTENGIGQLTLEDDDDDDEDSKKDVLTPEERKQKAQRERDEKQRAYEERRRELFGKDNTTGASSGGKKTGSPRNQSRANRGIENSRPSSSASSRARQLFDPGESTKPENLRPAKKDPSSQEIRPIREPRAPDSHGRGGFGFAPRGGRAA